jgi:hypothetical protein
MRCEALFAGFVSHPEYTPAERLAWLAAFALVALGLYTLNKTFPYTESPGGQGKEDEAATRPPDAPAAV